MSEKKKVRLTSSQLNDLYRRLDINGDGELDMAEFIGLGKKLNYHDENLLVAAFRSADTSSSGKLDVNEFIDAYDALYSGNIAAVAERATFVRATRYGIDKSHRPAKIIMHVYKGSITKLESLQDLLKDGSSPEPFEGDLTTLADMMVSDGESNKQHNSNLLWWVSVSAMDVLPCNVVKVIKSFGLPQDIDANFYSTFLTPERDTRLRMGRGKITSKKKKVDVKTLSFFVQSYWLFQRPMVQEFGPIFHMFCPPVNAIFQYITSRFSFLFSYAGMECAEGLTAIQRAEDQANNFLDADNIPPGEINVSEDKILNDALKLPESTLHDYMEASYLLTKSDLKARVPHLKYENLSVHVMDMGGFGPNCLLTFHKMDNEASVFKKDMGYDKEQLSRSGIVGRLVYGVFKRLYVVMKLGGAVPTGGELMDSSFYLVTSLIHLLHNGSMDALSQIEMWMAIVEADIDEMVVKKHIYHIRSIIDICENMKNYIEPFNGIMKDFVEQVVTDSKNKKSLRRSQQVAQAQAQIQAALSTPNKAAYGDEESTYLEETKTPMTPIGGTAAYRSPGQTPASKGTGTSEKDGVVFTPEEPYIDSKHFLKTLSLSTMMPFMRSEAGLSAAKSIREGNEQLEMKGSVFWLSRIEDFISRAELLKAGYKNKLDEKTNFWTFVLSLFTFFIFPLQCMCGYWGMNFDNMVELSGAWWPLIPGISLLWALSAVVYGLMLIIALHYRIIYSAT